jgi:hypothetical protein
VSRRHPRTIPNERTLEALEALQAEFGARIGIELADGPKGGWGYYTAGATIGDVSLTVFRLRRHRWCCVAVWHDKTRKPRRGVLYMTGARYFGSTARAAYLKALWAQSPNPTPKARHE